MQPEHAHSCGDGSCGSGDGGADPTPEPAPAPAPAAAPASAPALAPAQPPESAADAPPAAAPAPVSPLRAWAAAGVAPVPVEAPSPAPVTTDRQPGATFVDARADAEEDNDAEQQDENKDADMGPAEAAAAAAEFARATHGPPSAPAAVLPADIMSAAAEPDGDGDGEEKDGAEAPDTRAAAEATTAAATAAVAADASRVEEKDTGGRESRVIITMSPSAPPSSGVTAESTELSEHERAEVRAELVARLKERIERRAAADTSGTAAEVALAEYLQRCDAASLAEPARTDGTGPAEKAAAEERAAAAAAAAAAPVAAPAAAPAAAAAPRAPVGDGPPAAAAGGKASAGEAAVAEPEPPLTRQRDLLEKFPPGGIQPIVVEEVDGFRIVAYNGPPPLEPTDADNVVPPVGSAARLSGFRTKRRKGIGQHARAYVSGVLVHCLHALGGGASGGDITKWVAVHYPEFAAKFPDERKLRYCILGVLSASTYGDKFQKITLVSERGTKMTEWVLVGEHAARVGQDPPLVPPQPPSPPLSHPSPQRPKRARRTSRAPRKPYSSPSPSPSLEPTPELEPEAQPHQPTFVCNICGVGNSPEMLLLCDGCDGGFHLFCLDPPLSDVPRGHWFCDACKKMTAQFEDVLSASTPPLAEEPPAAAGTTESASAAAAATTTAQPCGIQFINRTHPLFRCPAVLDHPGGVMAMVWSSDGSQLLTAGSSGVARIWVAPDLVLARELGDDSSSGALWAAGFGPQDETVIVAGRLGIATLFGARTGAVFEQLEGPPTGIRAIARSTVGGVHYVITGGPAGHLTRWQMNSTFTRCTGFARLRAVEANTNIADLHVLPGNASHVIAASSSGVFICDVERADVCAFVPGTGAHNLACDRLMAVPDTRADDRDAKNRWLVVFRRLPLGSARGVGAGADPAGDEAAHSPPPPQQQQQQQQQQQEQQQQQQQQQQHAPATGEAALPVTPATASQAAVPARTDAQPPTAAAAQLLSHWCELREDGFHFEHVGAYAHEEFSGDDPLLGLGSNGRYVLAAASSGAVLVWNIMTHDLVAILREQTTPVRQIAFHPLHPILVTAGDAGVGIVYLQPRSQGQMEAHPEAQAHALALAQAQALQQARAQAQAQVRAQLLMGTLPSRFVLPTGPGAPSSSQPQPQASRQQAPSRTTAGAAGTRTTTTTTTTTTTAADRAALLGTRVRSKAARSAGSNGDWEPPVRKKRRGARHHRRETEEMVWRAHEVHPPAAAEPHPAAARTAKTVPTVVKLTDAASVRGRGLPFSCEYHKRQHTRCPADCANRTVTVSEEDARLIELLRLEEANRQSRQGRHSARRKRKRSHHSDGAAWMPRAGPGRWTKESVQAKPAPNRLAPATVEGEGADKIPPAATAAAPAAAAAEEDTSQLPTAPEPAECDPAQTRVVPAADAAADATVAAEAGAAAAADRPAAVVEAAAPLPAARAPAEEPAAAPQIPAPAEGVLPSAPAATQGGASDEKVKRSNKSACAYHAALHVKCRPDCIMRGWTAADGVEGW